MSTGKVLIVDDELEVRQILQEFLAHKGYEVHAAESGPEALNALDIFKPDVVLLDVSMPEMDGVETLSRLREDARTATIPVIFLTAKALPSEIERLRRLGALDVVVKPFNPMTLADELRTILSGVA